MFMERIPRIFAPLYEKAARMAGARYYREVAEEVVAKLKAGKVLDLGTGPGYLPLEIAGISRDITVTGVDLSARLIRSAKRNALRAGLGSRVQFQKGNASSLDFPDGSFDMVISTGMLHMLKSPVRTIDEIYRVLKPGGEAWIYDPARISSQISRKEWRASLSPVEKLRSRLFVLFARINPPREYHRDEVLELAGLTRFRRHEIEEKEGEIRLKLWKDELNALYCTR